MGTVLSLLAFMIIGVIMGVVLHKAASVIGSIFIGSIVRFIKFFRE